MNAFNFIDNMNGLCGGLGAIGAFFFALIAARTGISRGPHGVFSWVARSSDFCRIIPQARVFLGDAGSHLVGYLLAVMAILPHFLYPAKSAPPGCPIPVICPGRSFG